MADDDYRYITYETLDDGMIARIMLDRVETRNAQNRGLLVELNDAFLRAEADDTVRVVIFGGNGPMFSSGHDLGTPQAVEEVAAAVSFLVSDQAAYINGATLAVDGGLGA